MIRWLETSEQLGELLQELGGLNLAEKTNQDCIALDTEFVRTSHFYATPGLLQIGWQHQNMLHIRLIDINRLKASAVAHFMIQLYRQCHKQQRSLVMHAPSEDLQLFDTLKIPRTELPRLLDTQTAACFLGYRKQMSLFNLATELLKIPAQTSQAQSDWIQRPLSWAQMAYAANDVRLLLKIAPIITQRLQDQALLSAVLQDSCAVFQTEPLHYAQRPYSARQTELSRVPKHLQARLAQLFDWRETAIRLLDIPRKWLLTNEALLCMSRLGSTGSPPKIPAILQHIFYNKKKQHLFKLQRNAQDFFLQCLDIPELYSQFYQAWQELPPYPYELVPIRLGKKSTLLLKHLESLAQAHAQQHTIPYQAFMQKSWLKQLMLSFAQHKLGKLSLTPPILTGWRQDFTQAVEAVLQVHWPYHIE